MTLPEKSFWTKDPQKMSVWGFLLILKCATLEKGLTVKMKQDITGTIPNRVSQSSRNPILNTGSVDSSFSGISQNDTFKSVILVSVKIKSP